MAGGLLSNICRSPTAEGVFRRVLEEAGLAGEVEVDSCGLIDVHAGKAPDARATAAAARRGVDLTGQRARQVTREDFERFDLVLGMDDDVVRSLRELAPPAQRARVMHFLGLDEPGRQRPVPDPYYGGDDGFEDVLDLVEDGARRLLERVQQLRGA